MRTATLLTLPVLVLAAGCSSQPEAPAAPTFHELMKDEVDANADALWDITNDAIDETAGIDPAKMTSATWTQVATRAEAVRRAALKIATLDPIVVVKPGVKISDEGLPYGHTAAQVQAAIDANPQTLRDLANALAQHMGGIAEAASAHDPAKLAPLVNNLDSVCEDCHLEYWYPDQKAAVAPYRDK